MNKLVLISEVQSGLFYLTTEERTKYDALIKEWETYSSQREKIRSRKHDLLEPQAPKKPLYPKPTPSQPSRPDSILALSVLISFILMIYGDIDLFIREHSVALGSIMLVLGIQQIVDLFFVYSENSQIKFRNNKDIELYNDALIKFDLKMSTYTENLDTYNREVSDFEEAKCNELKAIDQNIKNIQGTCSSLLAKGKKRHNEASNASQTETVTKTNNNIGIDKVLKVIGRMSRSRRESLIHLLHKVREIQLSHLTQEQKSKGIRKVLWTDQSASQKLWIGAFIGTLFGLAVFGTGGIGVVGLGGAVGVWGFLSGTAGGVLIASLISNFEK